MSYLDKKGEAEFPFHRDVVFDAICQTVAGFDSMTIDTADKLSGRIMVKTGINFLNFGERIPIQLSALDDTKTKVQITSSPKGGVWLAGPIDFGRNQKNINKILGATSALLSARKPEVAKQTVSHDEGITDSVADELKKLKSLLDEGVLTQEEFWAQKSKLLK